MKLYFPVNNKQTIYKPVVANNEKEALKEVEKQQSDRVEIIKAKIEEYTQEFNQSTEGFDNFMVRQKNALDLFEKELSEEELGAELVKLEVIPNLEFVKQATKENILNSIEVSKDGYKEFTELFELKVTELEKQQKESKSETVFFVLEK